MIKKYLYLITLLFFVLGFFHIAFGWLGLACMITPFVLLIKDEKKTWCTRCCPRAALFTKAGRLGAGRKTPPLLATGSFKWWMLGYFFMSLTIIIASTLAAVSGTAPAPGLKLLTFFRLPFAMPQLMGGLVLPAWSIQFAYGFYSMMLTTTLIGLVLALVFKPRSWCSICPVNTLSQVYLQRTKNRIPRR